MPEHQQVEWKLSWRDEYIKWLCGFANAQGGVLEVGRDDSGQLIGIPDARRLLEEIPNKVQQQLGIVVDVNLLTENGLEYLSIRVEPYPYPVSYKGEYHLRSGSTKQQLKGAALDRFLLGKAGRHWDGVPLPRLATADLDSRALSGFRKRAERSQRLSAEMLTEADDVLIDRLHLKDGDYLKRAAALLFHPDPERFVTGAFVKIGYFANDADLLYHDEIHGDLFSQIERTLELLQSKYLKALISYDGLQRIETWPLPREALREAVLNALAHKDYASGTPVQISVYADRLMIWNPGALPPEWSVAHLTGKHASRPCNPDIANALFRAGLIESWGRGIERITSACATAGLPAPTFKDDGAGLWVEFPLRQQAVTDPVTGPVTDPVTRLLVALADASLAPSELQRRLGLKHRQTFRDNYLRPALAAGLIEMTLPDKPASRLQQYRTTDTGRQKLFASKAR